MFLSWAYYQSLYYLPQNSYHYISIFLLILGHPGLITGPSPQHQLQQQQQQQQQQELWSAYEDVRLGQVFLNSGAFINYVTQYGGGGDGCLWDYASRLYP